MKEKFFEKHLKDFGISESFCIFAKIYDMAKCLFQRDYYKDKISGLLDKDLIIVLTGQRRVGKSCIMQVFVEKLSEDRNNNVVYINKELAQYDFIKNHSDLTSYVSGKYQNDKRNYLFIDEVQEIIEFEKSLRSFQAEEQWQIMITGSNAKMLSSELSTLLAGRCIEIHIGSLNYLEFLQFHGLQDNDESLMQYLRWGGMPYLYRLGLDNEELVVSYLHTLYDTIVLKDIIYREKIRNAIFLKQLLNFVADNVGRIFSASSITKYMKSKKTEVGLQMVMEYLRYFCNAYVVDKVQRYDIHGKRLLELNEKYYFEDLGLRNSMLSANRAGDIECLIENAIYLQLKHQGYQVYVGQLKSAEIDFVAEKNGTRKYIQATYLLANEDTIQRKFDNLLKIPDNYEKMVISMDPYQRQIDFDGVKHLHLRQFLNT